MGVGDWIMATGESKRHHAKTGHRVMFVHPRGHAQWSEVFDNNPKIARAPGKDVDQIVQGGGLRPYIAAKQFRHWTWRPYTPTPGEFFFTPEEEEFGQRFRGAVLLEPNVKALAHRNKDWGWPKWGEVAHRLRDQRLIQVGPRGVQILTGVEHVPTANFRFAAAVLKYVRTAVMTEGGLMHAAAAVGTPSVVIWSEFIGIEHTGYAMHTNIRHAGKACGSRLDCPGCRKALDAVTVDEVIQGVGKYL